MRILTPLLLLLPVLTGRPAVAGEGDPEHVKVTLTAGTNGLPANLVQWQVQGHRQPLSFELRRSFNGNRDQSFQVVARELEHTSVQPHTTVYFWRDTNNVALAGLTPATYTYRVRAHSGKGPPSPWSKSQ